MNPEIEKLIDLSLVDGEITDKERSVILKKAVKLGEDPDEVEMILDARLHESKKLKTKEKVGNIKVCPSCGESVKSFQLNCSGCGHELNSRKQSELLNTMTQRYLYWMLMIFTMNKKYLKLYYLLQYPIVLIKFIVWTILCEFYQLIFEQLERRL